MKKVLVIAFAALSTLLGACATKPPATSMLNDWRAGTDYTPYRSIAPVVQCDGCKY